MRRTGLLLLPGLCAAILLPVWWNIHIVADDGPSVQRVRILMDTVVRIEVFGSREIEALAAIESAFNEMDRLSGVFSLYDPQSEVARLNEKAGEGPQPVSEDLFRVLEQSRAFSEATGGAFDVTIGAISRLWDFTAAQPLIPDSGEVERRMHLVNYRLMTMAEDRRVGLAKPGMAIDLGAAAKGYAVDRALDVLKHHGIRTGLVDAGGDIKVLGTKPNDKPWHIGVQHPRDGNGLIALLEMDSGSVATSGDYERYILEDGRRYHHILNPRTGWPGASCVSVTVVADQAIDADMLATAVFVLGPDEGIRLLDRISGAGGVIFYEKEGHIEHVLSGWLKDRVTFYH